jgi:hypothetical protein
MFKISCFVGVVAAMVLGVSQAMAEPQVDSYQVTGPIIELTDAKIVLQKDDGKWEIARTADTKIEGELKVGAKVTIKYRMTAVSAVVKAGKDDAKEEGKSAKGGKGEKDK